MQHTRTQKGGIITWDTADWRAGLGAEGGFASAGGNKQTDAQGWKTISKIDPFSIYGILSPGSAPTAFTNGNILTGTIIASQIYNSTFMTGLATSGVVHRMNYVAPTPSITNDTAGTGYPHTITGSNPVGGDLLFYQHNVGGTQVLSLFYSYYNNSSWDVGANLNVNNSVIGTFDDDYMSTTPAGEDGAGTVATAGSTTLTGTGTAFLSTLSPGDTVLVSGETARVVDTIASDTSLTVTVAFSNTNANLTYTFFPSSQRAHPHPMAVGADGLLYIGAGNKLNAYDGSDGPNGTFFPAVLTFTQGFEVIALRKYNDSLLIAGNYSPSSTTATTDGSGEGLVFVWNYIDENTTQVIPLEDPYVSALFIYRGNPTVITSGIKERNGTNKVKVITGISTTRIVDFDGAIPVQRGIVVADDVLYMNSGGKILAYGDRYNKSNAINNIATCNQSSTSGFLAYNFTNLFLMASSSLNSTYVVDNFGSAGIDSGSITGFPYQVELPEGKRARVVSVEVQYYSAVTANASNGAFTLSLNTDFGATSNTIVSSLSSLALPLTKRYLYTSSNTPLPNFTDIAPSMSWTAATNSQLPMISRLSIEYEILDLQSNTLI